MDMGPCPRAHQEKLQDEFKAAKAANPDDPVVQRIENEWQANIFGFVDDCDRKINQSQRRLEKTPEENAKTTALVSITVPQSVDTGWSSGLQHANSFSATPFINR
jgi:hypothetical protein